MKQIQLNNGFGGTSPFNYRESSCDELAMQQIFTNQDYSLVRLQLYEQINQFAAAKMAQGLRPLIIDLGANIGASATYFLLTYPSARVLAVEPDRDNFELLVANTANSDCISLRGAAASQKGSVSLVDPGLGAWGMRTQLGAGPLETFTVPELMEKHSNNNQFFPFIIKIDIEGAEAELFSQNTDWIDLFPVLIIELHDWLLTGQNNSRNFLKCIAGRARDFVYIGENVFSIRTPISGEASVGSSLCSSSKV